MKRLIVLLACVGCNSVAGIQEGQPITFEETDASVDHQSFCCTITNNDVDSSLWNNRSYPCFAYDDDSGMWIYPDGATGFQYPWVCFTPDNSPTDCNDPLCQLGASCRGPNGTGSVVQCQ
jgi:hypothetical protein